MVATCVVVLAAQSVAVNPAAAALPTKTTSQAASSSPGETTSVPASGASRAAAKRAAHLATKAINATANSTTARTGTRVQQSARTAPARVALAAACAVPGAPGNPTASAGGDNQASLSWTAAATNGTPLTGYVLAVAGGPKIAVAPDALTGTLSGIPGGARVLTVTAVSSCGAGPRASAASITVTGSGSTYSATTLSQAPVAYYRLGEADSVTIAADSASTNTMDFLATSRTTPGALGNDLDPGTNLSACCLIGQAMAALPKYDENRSVSAWVKPADAYERFLLGWGGNDYYTSFSVGLRGAEVLVDTYQSQLSFPINRAANDGNFHHLAVSVNNNAITVYWDALPLGTKSFANPLDTSISSSVVLGGDAQQARKFYGSLDEIAIFAKALSPAQVSAQFAASGWSRPGGVRRASLGDGGDNELVVTWGLPNAVKPPVTHYVVTASAGGQVRGATVVAASKTAARITGIPAQVGYTAAVTAVNRFGSGPSAATNSAVTDGASATYPAEVRADNPAAYFRLGESAGVRVGADSSGSGQNLSYSATTTRLPGALVGDLDQASDGGSSCCLGRAAATLPDADADRAVEAWVRPTAAEEQYFAGWGQAYRGFSVGTFGQRIVVSTYYGTTVDFESGQPLNDGAWHHVVVSYTAGRVAAYLDGRSLGEKNLALNSLSGGELVVGGNVEGYRWLGGLDELAVYAKPLTLADAQRHFSRAGHAPPAAPGALSATAGVNSAVLSWSAASSTDPLTRYSLRSRTAAGPGPAVMLGAGATTATLTGLGGGAVTTIEVQAVNSYGSSPVATTTVTPTGPAATYPTTVIGDGPRAYFRFAEAAGVSAAADSSGRGGLAVLRPGNSLGGAGAVELGAASAGSGTFSQAQASGLPRFASDRSVEAWIKPGDAYQRFFAGWGSAEAGSGFSVGTDAGAVVVNSSGEVLRFASSALAELGSWHHVAVVMNAGQVTVYLDGRSAGSKPFANPMSTDPLGGLIIGNNVSEGNPWLGGLDELAIYPTALTPAQVGAHFASSGHGPPDAPTAVTATAGTNRLSVRWDSVVPVDGISHYQVQARQGAKVVAAVATTGKFALLSGLPGGVAYTAQVVAVNPYGASPEGSSAAATPTGTASTYASSVLDDQPAAYYRLGESAGVPVAVDSSGRQQTLGVARGGRDAAGAIRGDGDTAALSDAAAPLAVGRADVPVGNDSRSVEVWIKPAEPYQGWLASWGSSGNRRAFAVSANDSELVVSAGTEQLKFPAPRNLDDATWHHLVTTYNGANRNVTVYLDGSALGTQSFNGPLNTPPGSTLRLSADTNGSTGFYGGIDELAIYPTALSASTVAAHFAASGHGRPNAPTSVSATPQANAVAVTWPAPTSGDPATGYVVTALQAGAVRQSVLVTSRTATLTGLAGGQAHQITVRASNGYGTGPVATSAAVTPTGPAGTFASTVRGQNPVAYYRLGEAVGLTQLADSAGQGTPMSVSSGTLGQPGALLGDVNPAVTVNGSPVGSTLLPSLPVGNAARSVQAWIRPDYPYQRFFAGWGATGVAGFSVGYGENAVQVSANGELLTFPTATLPTTWHHLAISYDGSAVTAYLDGLALGTRSFSGPLTTATERRLWVGAGAAGGAAWYGGLDELAVFPTALTSAQVAAQFAASGHGRPAAPGTVSASARPNGAAVSWVAPASADPLTGYLVTAIKSGKAVNATIVPPNSTTTTMTGLSGGSAYTISVAALTDYGPGLPRSSAAVTPSGSATTYASSVLAQNPLAYYRLGEATGLRQLADSGPSGAALVSAATRTAIAGALSTDVDGGSSNDAAAPIGTGLLAGLPRYNDARTVEAWVKPTDAALRWLAGWGGSSATDRQFNVGLQGTNVVLSTGSTSLSFPAGGTLNDGQWHHLAVTYNGTTATVYVDGVSQGAQPLSAQLNTAPGTRIWIGAGFNGASPSYGGVDEVAIYAASLSSAQILAHKTAGRP